MTEPTRRTGPSPRARLCALLLACMTGVSSLPAERFCVNYSAHPDLERLRLFDEVIVSPYARVDVHSLVRNAQIPYAYLSIVEIAPDARYRADALKRGIPLLHRNDTWNSDVVDVSDPAWTDYVVNVLAAEAAAMGFRGFFLDTADSIALAEQRDPANAETYRAGLIRLIKTLRQRYPDHRIILNRGFTILGQVMSEVNGVLVESLFRKYDFERKAYVPESTQGTEWLKAVLSKVRHVGAIWTASIFLTAIKDYKQVLIGFAVGSLATFLCSGLGGKWHGLNGAMIGFVLGHGLLLLLLFSAIYQEVGNQEIGTRDFLGEILKYWPLAICGFAYNLGIWIDKFLFWWLDSGAVQVTGILYAAPVYDRVVYFSFLTIVPGMAVFLLKLETDFARANENFFQHVLRKGTLDQIAEKKKDMIDALQDGFGLLLKVQGMFTVVLILSAEKVLYFLGMSAVQTGIFRISLIGTFLLVIFMSLLMVLHYLDKGMDAMICTSVFAAINGLITAASIFAGERWYGVGFTIAACVGMVMAAIYVNFHVRNLEYDTFTPQPLYG